MFKQSNNAWTALLSLILLSPCRAQTPDGSKFFRNALVVGAVGRSGRNPIHTDAIEHAIVSGKWSPPREGDVVSGSNGTNKTWKALSPDKEATFSSPELRGGYVYCAVVLDSAQIMVLEASGHNMVYVNGEPRAGDPYSNGILKLPVALNRGTNEFLFNVGRGRLQLKLVPAKGPVFMSLSDVTAPDIIRGNTEELWCALPIVNATDRSLTNLVASTRLSNGDEIQTTLPNIPPLTTRKVGFRFTPASDQTTNTLKLTVQLSQEAKILDSTTLSLRVRKRTEHYKNTFRSGIDGSIQYYAVAPPNPLPPSEKALALFLSTHGASVEAMGQADAYSSKPWGYLVAPTNRRPYGFDWEDWGRLDALEVLDLAQAKYKTDPAQTYLTGHSMGGHGAWQLGVTFPDRFAAVAPSAGWISFWSYAGATRSTSPTAVEEILQRAGGPSDTLSLASNYLQHAIYILHGDKDDNVPVSEARKMKERLSEFHPEFLYHEQPGAGHWWGNACVDWPPIFNLFARHKIPAPASVTQIRFATANPGVSASDHWVMIEAQEKALARSAVDISYEAGARKFTGTTENVARLGLDTTAFEPSPAISVTLDGQQIDFTNSPTVLRLAKRDGAWTNAARLSLAHKGPHRNGPFKEAFNQQMIFVYATHGSAEENAWAFSKARYDSESWWYRGNGSVDVIADSAFDPASEPNRGVILYGNAENNSAWQSLLNDSPVQVTRDSVRVGAHDIKGADLACLFLRPRPRSDRACVAVVSGTGLPGLRLTERVPYFLSGAAFPDCTVIRSDSLTSGLNGVAAAGFFGNDWSVETGEFTFQR